MTCFVSQSHLCLSLSLNRAWGLAHSVSLPPPAQTHTSCSNQSDVEMRTPRPRAPGLLAPSVFSAPVRPQVTLQPGGGGGVALHEGSLHHPSWRPRLDGPPAPPKIHRVPARLRVARQVKVMAPEFLCWRPGANCGSARSTQCAEGCERLAWGVTFGGG